MKKICFIVFVAFVSCSKSDDDTFSEQDFTISALVDGESFKSKGISDIFIHYEHLENGLYRLGIVASDDVEQLDRTKTILIRVLLTHPDYFGEGLVVTDTRESTTFNPYSFYEEKDLDTEVKIVHANTERTRLSSFTITKLNTDDKVISGTFEFTGYDSNSGQFHQVEQGIFNNLRYIDSTQ